jgi:acyl carrier protein
MSSNEEILKGIFVDIFPDVDESSFDWNKRQNEYENWDSFAHLRVISEIEEKFTIQLDIEDFMYINDATGFLKIIKDKTKT